MFDLQLFCFYVMSLGKLATHMPLPGCSIKLKLKTNLYSAIKSEDSEALDAI